MNNLEMAKNKHLKELDDFTPEDELGKFIKKVILLAYDNKIEHIPFHTNQIEEQLTSSYGELGQVIIYFIKCCVYCNQERIKTEQRLLILGDAISCTYRRDSLPYIFSESREIKLFLHDLEKDLEEFSSEDRFILLIKKIILLVLKGEILNSMTSFMEMDYTTGHLILLSKGKENLKTVQILHTCGMHFLFQKRDCMSNLSKIKTFIRDIQIDDSIPFVGDSTE